LNLTHSRGFAAVLRGVSKFGCLPNRNPKKFGISEFVCTCIRICF